MKKIIPTLISLFIFHFSLFTCSAQPVFTRNDSIPVKTNNQNLAMPWAGGHNFCQFSDIDLNLDSINDLFVFDRTGNKITTYINKGIPNTVNYSFSSKYTNIFPSLVSWALLVDYDRDGRKDIFTYAMPIAGIKVFRNISDSANGLKFTLLTKYIKTNYNPSIANLYVSQIDIPAIEDVDGDGDLDVLTHDVTGTIMEYHKNLSQEMGYGNDSLIYQLDQNGCWGKFLENANNCDIYLNQSCRMSSEAPQLYEQPILNPSQREGLSDISPFPLGREGDGLLHHSGSCALCLDMDADGDKDLLIGGVSCCNLSMLTNGGTSSAAMMTALQDTFPANTKRISMSLFPCGYFVDVNNDGKRDLLVSPNLQNVSIDKESIWYYQNINSDSAPVFSYVKNNLFQDEMIDVGEGAYPVLFDYNSDGLEDLLIGNSKLEKDSCLATTTYNMYAFRNNGTLTNPSFILDTTDFAGLSAQLPSVQNLYPAFGDLDNDGDSDMLIGDYNGQLYYFTNTAGGGNPCNFVLTQSAYPDDTGNPIDVGTYATPQLIDANRDGMLDIIIGEKGGNINYFENTGTPASPLFTFMNDSFGYVDVRAFQYYSGYSVPFMYDYNGSYKLIVGSESGYLYAYDNIDGNLSGAFTLVDSMYQKIWEGAQTAVTGKDINGDNVIDLMIGNYCGGVAFYSGKDTLTTVVQNQNAETDFTIFPNPTNGRANVQMWGFEDPPAGWAGLKMKDIEVYNMYGAKVAADFQISLSSKQGILRANLQIDLSEVSGGVYFITLKTSSGQRTKMVSVMR